MRPIQTFILIITIFTMFAVDRADGQILRKAGQLLMGKPLREAGKEGAKVVLRKSGSQLTQKAGRSGLQRLASGMVAKATPARHLVQKYGDDATMALTKISSQSSQRLGLLGDDIAASGYGSQLMKMIAEGGNGDQVVAFLWRNKGAIAGGRLLASFVLNPDPYLSATEGIATNMTASAGEFVGKPVVEHVLKPLSYGLAMTMLAIAIVCGFGVFKYQKHLVGLAVAPGLFKGNSSDKQDWVRQ